MRKLSALLLFSLSLLFAAEIRDGMLYLEINLATSQHLSLEGEGLELSDKDQLFEQVYSGNIAIDVVSTEVENRYGIIERVESAHEQSDSQAVTNSSFSWENDQLKIKHEYWFFLPDSFSDLQAAQSYASSINYPYSRIQSIPIVNSTLRIVDQEGTLRVR